MAQHMPSPAQSTPAFAPVCAWAASESEQAKASTVVRNERIMVTLSPEAAHAMCAIE